MRNATLFRNRATLHRAASNDVDVSDERKSKMRIALVELNRYRRGIPVLDDARYLRPHV
jgi:hypothetical protein